MRSGEDCPVCCCAEVARLRWVIEAALERVELLDGGENDGYEAEAILKQGLQGTGAGARAAALRYEKALCQALAAQLVAYRELESGGP